MSQYEAQVNVKVDDSALDKAQQKLDSLTKNGQNVKVKITADTSDFSKSVGNKFKNEKIKISVDDSTAKSSIKSIQSEFQKLKSLGNEIGRLKTKSANLNLNPGKNSNQINALTTQINKLESEYNSLYNTVSKDLSTSQLNQLNSAAEKASRQIEIINAKAEDLSSTMKTTVGTFSQLDAQVASNRTLSWLQNNTKAADKYGDQLIKLAELQRNATSKEELQGYTRQVRALQTEAQAFGETGRSWQDNFGRAFGQIFQFSQIYGGIQKVIDATAHAVTELKEMDNILTEISKVSDMSSSELQQLGQDAFDYANQYGKTVTDYLTGVQEMNRSGFYGQQGIDLANTSVLAQAAGDMTADVANSYLLATNAAYEYAGSAEKLNAVLDGQNMITNRNSVNMTDMAEATTQAGSMAAQAGVEVDELSALIGTAVARTKKDGNEIGTALKSLFVNLQNTQSDKIVTTFDRLGISMTKMVDDTEVLKTPIELLEELSTVYNSLPDGSTTKADILTNLAGKYHANVLSSILAGWSDYEQMVIDYSEGSGSAAVEAEKSANNWQGSLNKLSNSWTEFVSNFANSGQITTAIQFINSFVQAMDGLVNTLTPLGTVATGAGIFAFIKNLD